MSFPSNNAREWSDIVALYSSFSDRPWGAAMERLVTGLRDSGFVKAGLHGTTSMADLLLGPSHDVLNNPHLRIRPTATDIRLSYEDGSIPAWRIAVSYEELSERVERILVKRARWFRSGASDVGS